MIEPLEARRFLSAATPAGSHLVWLDQPADFVAGNRVPPIRVTLEDSTGTVLHDVTGGLRNPDGTVAFTLLRSTDNSFIIHTQNLIFSHGIAQIPQWKITNAGAYDLEANLNGRVTILSNSFTVTPAPAVRMKIVDFSPDVFNFQVTIQMLDKFGNLATANSSLIENDGSRGNGEAEITAVGPNVVLDDSSNFLGVRFIDGVANFGVSLQRDTGKQSTQLRLKDSNPGIPPIWTPILS